MTELAVRQPSGGNLPAKLEYARTLAASGLLPAQYRSKPENVLYAVEYGDALGISPMAAITGVHVIEGKPSASANLIGALVRRAGHKLRVTGDNESATAIIIRNDDPDFEFKVTWTMDMARAAGLANKGTWKNYPQAMLKSRAISQVARDACEEALFGLHYTPEELGVETDGDGNIVGGVVEPSGPPLPSPDQIKQAVADALRTDKPRAALLSVWNSFGPPLGQVIIETPDGRVTGAQYVKDAGANLPEDPKDDAPGDTVDAEIVPEGTPEPSGEQAALDVQMQDGTDVQDDAAAEAAASEPVDAEIVPEPEPPAKVAANAAQDAEAAKPSAKDRQVEAWLREARFQAESLGVQPVDFIAPLLAEAKTTDPYALTVAGLKRYVVPARARVIKAMQDAGKTAQAGAYFSVANDQPAHPEVIVSAGE